MQKVEINDEFTAIAVKESMQIGEIVKFHRESAGLTQAGLADLAGVGKTVVFDVEKGKATVKLATLIKILDVLAISFMLCSKMIGHYGEEDEKS